MYKRQTVWFETGKGDKWHADWITPKADKTMQVSVEKVIDIKKPVKRVRMYVVGLGVYELYLNGKKQEMCIRDRFYHHTEFQKIPG